MGRSGVSVLKLKNSEDYLIIDPSDWNTVKDILWFVYKGQITTRSGIPYEEVCCFPSNTKNIDDNLLDKRRDRLVPKEEQWVWSEFYGKMIQI